MPPRGNRPEPSRLAIGATTTLRTNAHFAIADGLFGQAGVAALAADSENRSIDADSL